MKHKNKFAKMQSLVKTIGLVLAAGSLGACTVVDQGNFSIEKNKFTGSYSQGYGDSGYTSAWFHNVYEINGKEILIDVGGLQPKDKDGILLKDMNITITYKVNPKRTVDFVLQTGDIGQYNPVQLDNSMGSEILGSNYVIGYNTIKKEASTNVQRVTREWESLGILNDREGFEKAVADSLNADLKEKYGDVFTVSNAKTYIIRVGDTIEGRMQAIAAAQTATAKANAEFASLQAQKALMLQETQNIADVAKSTGLSPQDVLQYQMIKALRETDRNVTPTVDVSSNRKPKL